MSMEGAFRVYVVGDDDRVIEWSSRLVEAGLDALFPQRRGGSAAVGHEGDPRRRQQRRTRDSAADLPADTSPHERSRSCC